MCFKHATIYKCQYKLRFGSEKLLKLHLIDYPISPGSLIKGVSKFSRLSLLFASTHVRFPQWHLIELDNYKCVMNAKFWLL